jgi:hypothetical protein
MAAASAPTPSGRVIAVAVAQVCWNPEKESSYYDDVTSTG